MLDNAERLPDDSGKLAQGTKMEKLPDGRQSTLREADRGRTVVRFRIS